MLIILLIIKIILHKNYLISTMILYPTFSEFSLDVTLFLCYNCVIMTSFWRHCYVIVSFWTYALGLALYRNPLSEHFPKSDFLNSIWIQSLSLTSGFTCHKHLMSAGYFFPYPGDRSEPDLKSVDPPQVPTWIIK